MIEYRHAERRYYPSSPIERPDRRMPSQKKPEKLLRNTNLSIDKENLIIINLIIDYGPHSRDSPERSRVNLSLSISQTQTQWA